MYKQGCRFLLSIGGDNLQFHLNFALFLTLGEMNLDYDFVQVSKLREDQKKVFTKNGTLFSTNSGEDQKKKGLHLKWNTFSPNSLSGHLRSDAHQSQIIGGDADVHHRLLKLLGCVYTAKLLGGYITPSPPGFGTPVYMRHTYLQITRKEYDCSTRNQARQFL